MQASQGVEDQTRCTHYAVVSAPDGRMGYFTLTKGGKVTVFGLDRKANSRPRHFAPLLSWRRTKKKTESKTQRESITLCSRITHDKRAGKSWGIKKLILAKEISVGHSRPHRRSPEHFWCQTCLRL